MPVTLVCDGQACPTYIRLRPFGHAVSFWDSTAECGNEVNVATWEHELVGPPAEARARELWLQHAAGFILFEDVRRYATEQIDPALSDEVRAAVQKGIDDAVYGLMMVIDGVSGGLANASHNVSIDFIVRLAKSSGSTGSRKIAEINLRDGDGMCMGYHGWLEGDFGKNPVAVRRPDAE